MELKDSQNTVDVLQDVSNRAKFAASPQHLHTNIIQATNKHQQLSCDIQQKLETLKSIKQKVDELEVTVEHCEVQLNEVDERIIDSLSLNTLEQYKERLHVGSFTNHFLCCFFYATKIKRMVSLEISLKMSNENLILAESLL